MPPGRIHISGDVPSYSACASSLVRPLERLGSEGMPRRRAGLGGGRLTVEIVGGIKCDL